MYSPLPIIQTIPHGGLDVPPEVAENLALDPVTIYNECDLWVDHLFDFSHPDLAPWHAATGYAASRATLAFPMARVLIDVNRAPGDFANPDGPVKSRTSYGDPVYHRELAIPEQAALANRYYAPFHTRVEEALAEHAGGIRLFLDCHSMAQVSPDAYQFAGAARPLLCLCNFGDDRGRPRAPDRPTTCSAAFLRAAAELAEPLFADLELLEPQPGPPPPVVALNWPFWGGYILQHYSRPQAGRSAPGLMVEVNRGLYVGNQTTRSPIQPPNLQRIGELRERLFRWIGQVVRLLESQEAENHHG